MSSLTNYFNRKQEDIPKPKFVFGDRVFGRKEKIPFVGTVQREIGSMVLIQTDLPLPMEGGVCSIISVTQSDIQRLLEM